VQPGGEQDRQRVVHALAQLPRVVGDGRGVQVDDAIDRLAGAVLAGDVLLDRPDVVAQVLSPRGLDAREDPHVAAQGSLSPPPRKDSMPLSRPAHLAAGAALAVLAAAPAHAAYAPKLAVSLSPSTPGATPAITSTISQAAGETANKTVRVSFPA